jgi:hypothetical protein
MGVRHNRIAQIPLVESVAATRAVADHIAAGDYEQAMTARGGSFRQMVDVFATMSRPPTRRHGAGRERPPGAAGGHHARRWPGARA